MKQNIKIDAAEYEIDWYEENRGTIIKLPEYPLKPGDVYRCNGGTINPFLLIRCCYDGERAYQLMGLACTVNSGNFFNSLHTKEEIVDYLRKNSMVYSHNVGVTFYNLFNPHTYDQKIL